MEQYYSLIYNLQFKRKIAPSGFLLSEKGMKIAAAALASYYFTDGKTMVFLLTVIFLYGVKKYMETRLTFRSKLSRYNKTDRDMALPIHSWLAAIREDKVKASVGGGKASMIDEVAKFAEGKENKKEKKPEKGKK